MLILKFLQRNRDSSASDGYEYDVAVLYLRNNRDQKYDHTN